MCFRRRRNVGSDEELQILAGNKFQIFSAEIRTESINLQAGVEWGQEYRLVPVFKTISHLVGRSGSGTRLVDRIGR